MILERRSLLWGRRKFALERKVQTGFVSELGGNLRRVSAGFSFPFPHTEEKTGLELTRLESNRDERV